MTATVGAASVSVDVRTRVDEDAPVLDPAHVFGELLPTAIEEHEVLLRGRLAERPPRPLAAEVGDRRWTLREDAGRLRVEAGGDPDGATIVLDAQQVHDLVTDQATPMAWFTSGTLRLQHSRLEHVLDWWLLLRAALDGRAPHTPGAVSFTTPSGDPLDLGRSFTLDDDPADLAWFLSQAGFLHVEGMFTAAEMTAVSADMDRAAPTYAPDDGRSWWAQLADGTDALVRMQHFDEQSATTAELVASERFQELGALTGDGHAWGARRANRLEALFKPIGVTRGISDVPWHKDCSLGRHSYECCSLTVGISVTGADAVSGQLSVVAGSHRALVWPAPVVQPGLDLPVIDLPTRTGDVTVHLSCTMHMAHPPTERPRRVMYTGFSLPPANPEQARLARQRLGAAREAAPRNVSQPAATR